MADTPDKFDWVNDEAVLVRHQPAIAIYTNKAGQAVIRREAEWNDEEDAFVQIDPAHAIQVAHAILEAAGHHGIEFIRNLGGNEYFGACEDVPIPPPYVAAERKAKDPTAAERQRRHRETKKRNGESVTVTPETVTERDIDRDSVTEAPELRLVAAE